MNLETAVSYINKPESGILSNYTLNVDVIMSQDNDSYGAMEEGQ